LFCTVRRKKKKKSRGKGNMRMGTALQNLGYPPEKKKRGGRSPEGGTGVPKASRRWLKNGDGVTGVSCKGEKKWQTSIVGKRATKKKKKRI